MYILHCLITARNSKAKYLPTKAKEQVRLEETNTFCAVKEYPKRIKPNNTEETCKKTSTNERTPPEYWLKTEKISVKKGKNTHKTGS